MQEPLRQELECIVENDEALLEARQSHTSQMSTQTRIQRCAQKIQTLFDFFYRGLFGRMPAAKTSPGTSRASSRRSPPASESKLGDKTVHLSEEFSPAVRTAAKALFTLLWLGSEEEGARGVGIDDQSKDGEEHGGSYDEGKKNELSRGKGLCGVILREIEVGASAAAFMTHSIQDPSILLPEWLTP